MALDRKSMGNPSSRCLASSSGARQWTVNTAVPRAARIAKNEQLWTTIISFILCLQGNKTNNTTLKLILSTVVLIHTIGIDWYTGVSWRSGRSINVPLFVQ